MRLPILLLALGGLAMIALAAVYGGGHLTGNESGAAVASLKPPSIPKAMPPAEAAKAPRAKARPVAPEVFAPPELAPESLERIAPRAPLGELALALPPKPGVPKATLLYRPVATAAGRLEAEGHLIAIEGIVPVEPEQECLGPDGSSWPCGMIARTAFRNWLRGRAVECTVGEPPATGAVISACGLGKQDVGLWLVENGFAVPQSGSAYMEAGDKAKAGGRGIFGAAPKVTP